MKKVALGFTIGVSVLVLIVTFVLNSKPSSIKQIKQKPKQAANIWAKKQSFKPSKYTAEVQPPENFNSEIIDLMTAKKYLGFNLQLPKSPKATAAGEPKIIAPKDTTAYVRTKGTPPKPNSSLAGGAAVRIQYPNGLVILVKIRHPQDPTKNYALHIEETNKNKRYWTEKGYMDGKYLELTTVNGFKGMQEDAGFNFVGFLGDDTPSPELKEPAPAMVVWYDDKNWAEYDVRGPIGVSLKELREVVDSIYQ